MTLSTVEKAWFVLSLVVLAFGYGFASAEWGLFPKSYVETAWQQVWALTKTPTSGPQVYDRHGARTLQPDAVQPGKTLISSAWKVEEGWEVGLRLISRNGDVLHKWVIDRENVFRGDSDQRGDPEMADVHGSLLLPDGDVVVNLSYVGMARLNSCGDVLWTQAEGNHHSIAQDEDGSFWVSGVSNERRTQSEQFPDGYPGIGSPVWVDRILHVGQDGTLLDDISIFDILYENDLERYIAKMRVSPPDVTHLNDVEPLSSEIADEYPLFEAGDLLVSLRHIDLVFVFDPETKNVKWHTRGPFIRQHDPDFIGDGWIGIFDNSDKGMFGGSRIVALQPHTDSTEVLFDPRDLERFYTLVQGKWEALENGNLLLTEAGAGRGVEVTPDGELVWEWIHEPFGDSEVPAVTKVSRKDVTRGEIASWPCSSVDSIQSGR